MATKSIPTCREKSKIQNDKSKFNQTQKSEEIPHRKTINFHFNLCRSRYIRLKLGVWVEGHIRLGDTIGTIFCINDPFEAVHINISTWPEVIILRIVDDCF